MFLYCWSVAILYEFVNSILRYTTGMALLKIGYNTYRGWTQTEYQNKHYNIDQKDEGHRTTEEEM